MDELQQANSSRTVITTYKSVDVWQLAQTIPGQFWDMKLTDDLYHELYYPPRSNVTFASKPRRLAKLGSLKVVPGIDVETEPFPCPFSSEEDKEKRRITIELSCDHCMVSFDHVFEFPILGQLEFAHALYVSYTYLQVLSWSSEFAALFDECVT
jgi:hypothetical protein